MDLAILTRERRALLDGQELTVGAWAFDILAYLHANSDRVVTKKELLDHVWAGMLVEEGNLSVQITGLRKELGREAIKTVPGVGYQLSLAQQLPRSRDQSFRRSPRSSCCLSQISPARRT